MMGKKSDPDVQMFHTLWELGRPNIFSWIISNAKGIAELENSGKYHCDMDFRNTVKFAGIFKIIDFDYFFTVRQGRNKADAEAYEHMKLIITEFLKRGRLDKRDCIIGFLFPSLANRDNIFNDNQSKFDYNAYINKVL